MPQEKTIVEQPIFLGTKITKALSIAYTIQLCLLTGVLFAVFGLLYGSHLHLLRAVILAIYLGIALFTACYFLAVRCRNRLHLRTAEASQILAIIFTISIVVGFTPPRSFRRHSNELLIGLCSVICLCLLVAHLETILILRLSRRCDQYFAMIEKADCCVKDTQASIKIQEDARPKEVVQLSPPDLCRFESSEVQTKLDKETLDLPAPISKFHSISLDSYHDCEEE